MYRVTNEFVDLPTGRRVQPGEDFEPHDEKQAARLVNAGCLERIDAKRGAGKQAGTEPPKAERADGKPDGATAGTGEASEQDGDNPPPGDAAGQPGDTAPAGEGTTAGAAPRKPRSPRRTAATKKE